MNQTAYIRMVEGSTVPSVSMDELKDLLVKYIDQTTLTGKQLDWDYADAAFPYTIENNPVGDKQWFYLKGKNPLYKYIVLGLGSDTTEDQEVSHYIQMVLPENSTHGDKAKGNEFCKYLGRQLKAELQLFNGRIMYYNPRKL